MNIIVLAKQVPDTRNVGKDAMREDGTVNRTALPAIFNPEDLNALEQALRIKYQYPDTTISVLTMGPFRAADVIRSAGLKLIRKFIERRVLERHILNHLPTSLIRRQAV